MPYSWMEDDAARQRSQADAWRFGRVARRTFSGRVLREGSEASTDDATYWDVILLAEGNKEIDLVASGVLANPLPVRPLILNVVGGASATYASGDIISVDVNVSSGRRDGVVETGDGTEDYMEVFPGDHMIISSAGTGGCYGSILFAVLP